MKQFNPRHPRGPLAAAAFVLAAATLSVFVVLPLAVESHVPELGAIVTTAAACPIGR